MWSHTTEDCSLQDNNNFPFPSPTFFFFLLSGSDLGSVSDWVFWRICRRPLVSLRSRITELFVRQTTCVSERGTSSHGMWTGGVNWACPGKSGYMVNLCIGKWVTSGAYPIRMPPFLSQIGHFLATPLHYYRGSLSAFDSKHSNKKKTWDNKFPSDSEHSPLLNDIAPQ